MAKKKEDRDFNTDVFDLMQRIGEGASVHDSDGVTHDSDNQSAENTDDKKNADKNDGGKRE